jgi:pentatricopeptide repeat protein
MKVLQLPLNETAYTAIVKVLVRNQEFQTAEQVLDESETVQQCKPRLRLYSSLLVAYCEHRQMIKALKCWRRITQHRLELTEKEFLSLIKCAIATGDVPVMDRVLSDLAELVAVPSKDTVSAILEWFASPHSLIHYDPLRIPKHANEDNVKSLLQDITKDEVEPPPSMGPVQTEKGWQSSSSVLINTETGTLLGGCLDGSKLQPVPLSERAWSEMITMNETIVLEGKVEGNSSEFQGGKKGQIRTNFDPQERRVKWKEFTRFLEAMGPIDVVIDAANVGYYKQNFATAPKHVDYEQIDWVARKFQSMGKKVLLVLHQRHFSPNLMPQNFKPLQEEWERQGILYKTASGCNDDWYWLHAALRYRTVILTNDEMRDHHFQMLAPRTFLRWKERHQVHFSFGEWEIKKDSHDHRRGREVYLEFPSPYSRRIQRVEGEGLVVPLIKKGDENRFLDGTHVADDDEPVEETYLCIRAITP